MVQEMITAVKDAEKKAEEIIEDGKKQSAKLITTAKENAKLRELQTIEKLKTEKERVIEEERARLKAFEEAEAALIVEDVADIQKRVAEKEENAILEIMKNFY